MASFMANTADLTAARGLSDYRLPCCFSPYKNGFPLISKCKYSVFACILAAQGEKMGRA
jgi:hypothetical protein